MRYLRVGQALRKFRTDRELTLEYVAIQANITHQQLSRIETGRRRPTLITLHKIDCVLRLPDALLLAFIRQACCYDPAEEEAS